MKAGKRCPQLTLHQKCFSSMKIAGYEVEVTHPDKVLFPKSKITKQELVDYYVKASKYILPHTKGRPVSMQRFPEGINHQGFYQKEISDFFPAFIKRQPVNLKTAGRKKYIRIENPATLAYLANLGNIPIHAWLSKKGQLNRPDLIMWDFDPSDGKFQKAKLAAQHLYALFHEAGIEPWLKTTGSRGLHVVLPILPKYSFARTRKVAKQIADTLVSLYPKLLTVEVSKEKRGKKVFVDYLRNGFAQTAVAPYSVRAIEKAPVSMPIRWEELEDPGLKADTYNVSNVLKRLKRTGDVWENMEDDPLALEEIEKVSKLVNT